MDDSLVLIDSFADGGVPDTSPGDVVRVDEGIGVIRYVGEVRFATGGWAGIELVEKMGMHDGCVGGKRYFKCKSKHGIFVELSKIQQKILPEELLERVTMLNSEARALRKENDKLLNRIQLLEKECGRNDLPSDYLGDIEIGDKIRLTNSKTGTVRYVGRTHFDSEMMYGIELDSWISNGNDGSKGGRRYFKCRTGWGYFARKGMIANVTERVRDAKTESQDEKPSIEIGQRVEIDGNRRGIVKFVGSVAFAKGEYVGVELEQWRSYGHDGKVKGRRYFNAQPGKGYLCKAEYILRILPHEEKSSSSTRGKRESEYSRHQDREDLPPSLEQRSESLRILAKRDRAHRRKSLNELVVGDKVRLTRGRVGWVRYIGRVHFTSGEVIGLELDQWTERGHDGRVKGERYFSCVDGRGYFTKRQNISEIISSKESQMVQSGETDRGHEIRPSDLDDDGPIDFEIGDRVKLSRGRTGVVRYISNGRMPGVKNSEVIGLELDQWSEKGHDGYLKGKQYFKCQPGRGYWTTRGVVTRVLERRANHGSSRVKRMDSFDEQSRQTTKGELLDACVGDHVTLSRGREGIVRFIGEVQGMKKKEVIGLELDQWAEKGHNGSWRGVSYFDCKPGRGYFTTRSAITKINRRSSSDEMRPTPGHYKDDSLDDKEKDKIIHVAVGDRVRLKGGRTGTIQFKGKASFAKGEILGLELDQWAPKGNDGTKNGEKYFECASGHGYFTRPSAVVEKLQPRLRRRGSSVGSTPSKKLARKLSTDSQDSSGKKSFSLSEFDYNIGDKVRLNRGKVGVIKYIGKVGQAQTELLVGLELDQWYEKGNDGSFRGVKYFNVRGSGWGYFTKPQAISGKIDD